MKLIPVESSNIESVGHEGTTLTVKFKKSGAYQYQNVSPELHSQLMAAESIGGFFAANIKKFPSEFPYQKV